MDSAPPRPTREDLVAALAWQVEAGVDEAVEDVPTDWFAESARGPAPTPTRRVPDTRPTAGTAPPRPVAAGEAARSAEELAVACESINALRVALERFDDCPLKATAQNLVFCDGNPEASVMLVGEAPGADEDRQGLPFVGRSGQLLDRMMAAIGLDRRAADPAHAVFISNIIFWRPPGNRKPTDAETVICLPFIKRAIALVRPRVLVCLGGTPFNQLLGTNQGILRSRGTWRTYRDGDLEIPLLPTLHPAYLLRNPAAKKLAWADMLSLKEKLAQVSD